LLSFEYSTPVFLINLICSCAQIQETRSEMQEKLRGSMAAMKEMALKQDSRIDDLSKNIVVSVCGDDTPNTRNLSISRPSSQRCVCVCVCSLLPPSSSDSPLPLMHLPNPPPPSSRSHRRTVFCPVCLLTNCKRGNSSQRQTWEILTKESGFRMQNQQ
jgi:hypothetical protein